MKRKLTGQFGAIEFNTNAIIVVNRPTVVA